MPQEEITILRVHKSTRNKLRKLAITRRESYDEILNRLIGDENKDKESEDELEKDKQKLLKEGISKDIVDLLGVIPGKISLEDEKKMVGRAIRKKYGIE